MKGRRREGRNPVVVGGLVLLIAVLGTLFAFVRDIPGVNEPYTVKAAFTDSHGMRKGAPVRIAGVDVGEVTGIELTEPRSRSAVVTMALREGALPVRRDASARIRPRIFLEGNFYIQLSPGTPGAPEMDQDETIPAERTSSAVQLDEILKALRTDVRRDLRGLFAELFRTESAGGARAFRESLPDQAAAYRWTAVVTEAMLGRRPGDLGDFIRDQGVVSEALTADRRALRDLVTNFNRTVTAVADREADLRAAVNELPATLEAALPTFDALNAAFPAVREFSVAARPGIASTVPAARAATPLARQLRGLVSNAELRGLSRDLREAIPNTALLAQASPAILDQIRRISSCTSNTLVPYGNSTVGDPNFPASGRVHQEFPKSLVGLAGESRSFDANGQWFKVLGTGGVETFSLGNGLLGSSATSIIGVNPPPVRERPPLNRDAPCENQEQPDLRSTPVSGPQRVETDPQSPAVQARIAKARKVAIDIRNEQLRAQGSKVRVLDRDVTRQEIEQLAQSLGLSGQLQTLTQRNRAGRVR
jgi:phospholipid/cholesterol/gamma-HCH transport system substrate-binding protein